VSEKREVEQEKLISVETDKILHSK